MKRKGINILLWLKNTDVCVCVCVCRLLVLTKGEIRDFCGPLNVERMIHFLIQYYNDSKLSTWYTF